MIASRLILAAASLFSAAFAPYMHAQRLVDIGGRRLNIYCTGRGSPTVILDTDGDDSTLAWRFVQPQIARRTRVCSYDAGGLGFSDPAPSPNDAQAMAASLHALIVRAAIARPVVLVGYSLSGLSDRIYADRYRGDVAGMVLVDPNIPYETQRLAALVPPLAAALSGAAAWDEKCYRYAQNRMLRAGTQAFDACMWPTGPADPALPGPLRQVLQQQWRRPTTWYDLFLAQRAADSASSAEVTREQRSYGAMPLVVLSSDVSVVPLPISASQKRELAHRWKAWHDSIANLSTEGASFLVDGSNEAIATQRPSSVVSAIDEVVSQVRGAK